MLGLDFYKMTESDWAFLREMKPKGLLKQTPTSMKRKSVGLLTLSEAEKKRGQLQQLFTAMVR